MYLAALYVAPFSLSYQLCLFCPYYCSSATAPACKPLLRSTRCIVPTAPKSHFVPSVPSVPFRPFVPLVPFVSFVPLLPSVDSFHSCQYCTVIRSLCREVGIV